MVSGGRGDSVLHGSVTVKMDEKGRVKIPANLRRLIQDRFGACEYYVTSMKGDCALVYPERVWDELLRKLSTQSPTKPPVKRFRRATSYWGQMASMDPQGRIMIHPRLRTDAGLDTEVVILGQKDYIEIWDHKKFKGTLQDDPVTEQDEEFLATLDI